MIPTLANECLICRGSLGSVIQLPDLPITGIYTKEEQDINFRNFDQELLLCSECGHAQLRNTIDITYLYGETYSFRTSASETAKSGAHFLLTYLEYLFPSRVFDRIVEFGCNDAYLLKLLKSRGQQLLGIDLVWKGRESEFNDDKIEVCGEMIENISFVDIMGDAPDLILSQHTLEHIEDPIALMKKLLSVANQNTIFLFEFPCFDILLDNLRFDQVFHQHIHYYSVRSFLRLLYSLGGELIDYTINYNYWGSLLVAFKKGKNNKGPVFECIDENYPEKCFKDVRSRYRSFKQQMESTMEILDKLRHEVWYGYGAALMLPILGYHLDMDFGNLKGIFDDDPAKDGVGYINLPVKILNPAGRDFSDISICLTAMDNRRVILKKLVQKEPRRILNPLSII